MKTTVFWDSFGITQRALKRLRDELCRRFEHDIVVFEWSNHNILCGYLIIDDTTKEIIVIGDSFRTDDGGEGGAGRKSAEALFLLMGIRVEHISIPEYEPDFEQDDQNRDKYRKLVEASVEETIKNEYGGMIFAAKISDSKPQYVRS